MSSITCSLIIQIIIIISIIGFILKSCKVNDKNGCLAIVIFIILICIIPIPIWLGLPITLWLAQLVERFGDWFSSNAGCIIIPIILLGIFGGPIIEFIGDIIDDIQAFGFPEGIFENIRSKNKKDNPQKEKFTSENHIELILTKERAKELFSNNSQIIIPNNYTSIGNNAFENYTSLENIYIPESITKIGMLAFSGCTSLSKIKIPNSVTEIGYSAFEDVDTVYYNGSAEGSPWGAKNHKKYKNPQLIKDKNEKNHNKFKNIKSKNKTYRKNKEK